MNRAERRAAHAIVRKVASPPARADVTGRIFDRWGRDRTDTIAELARRGVTADKWDIELFREGARFRLRSVRPHDAEGSAHG